MDHYRILEMDRQNLSAGRVRDLYAVVEAKVALCNFKTSHFAGDLDRLLLCRINVGELHSLAVEHHRIVIQMEEEPWHAHQSLCQFRWRDNALTGVLLLLFLSRSV